MNVRRILFLILEFLLPASWAERLKVAEPADGLEPYPRQQKERGIAMRTGTRWILTLGSVIIGAWISVDLTRNIGPATAAFLGALPAPWYLSPNFGAIVFWLVVLIWARALFIRLAAEDRSEERYRRDLMRALFRLPNLNVLWDYKRYHNEVADVLINTRQKQSIESSATTLGEDIQYCLAAVAEMAKVFSRNHDSSYGASIMLVIQKKDIPRLPEPMRTSHRSDGDPVEDGNPNGLLYFAGYRTEVNLLDGLLILTSDLVLLSTDDASERKSYPLICLPIRKGPKSQIIPGAPTAVLNDKMSTYEDTRLLADTHCAGLSEPSREEVRNYFSQGGVGESVRSFASFRLDSGAEPVGVLNIDCDSINVLGGDDAYYTTFYALLRPILRLLGPLVKEYAVAWWAEIDAGRTQPSLVDSTPAADLARSSTKA